MLALSVGNYADASRDSTWLTSGTMLPNSNSYLCVSRYFAKYIRLKHTIQLRALYD